MLRTVLKAALVWLALTVQPYAANAEPVHLRGSFVIVEQPDDS